MNAGPEAFSPDRLHHNQNTEITRRQHMQQRLMHEGVMPAANVIAFSPDDLRRSGVSRTGEMRDPYGIIRERLIHKGAPGAGLREDTRGLTPMHENMVLEQSVQQFTSETKLDKLGSFGAIFPAGVEADNNSNEELQPLAIVAFDEVASWDLRRLKRKLLPGVPVLDRQGRVLIDEKGEITENARKDRLSETYEQLRESQQEFFRMLGKLAASESIFVGDSEGRVTARARRAEQIRHVYEEIKKGRQETYNADPYAAHRSYFEKTAGTSESTSKQEASPSSPRAEKPRTDDPENKMRATVEAPKPSPAEEAKKLAFDIMREEVEKAGLMDKPTLTKVEASNVARKTKARLAGKHGYHPDNVQNGKVSAEVVDAAYEAVHKALNF